MCKVGKDPGGKNQFNNVNVKVSDLPKKAQRGKDLNMVVAVSSGQKVVKTNPKVMRRVILRGVSRR